MVGLYLPSCYLLSIGAICLLFLVIYPFSIFQYSIVFHPQPRFAHCTSWTSQIQSHLKALPSLFPLPFKFSPKIFLQLTPSLPLCSDVTLRGFPHHPYSLSLLHCFVFRYSTFHHLMSYLPCLLIFFLLRLECRLQRRDLCPLFCSWTYHQHFEWDLANRMFPDTFLNKWIRRTCTKDWKKDI